MSADLERRLIVARALAAEHGMPLGFHDEEDQLEWDRKACQVLRDLAATGLDFNDEAQCDCGAGEHEPCHCKP